MAATSTHGDTVHISEEANKKSVQAAALNAIGTIGAIMVGISAANQAVRNDIRHVVKDTTAGQFALGALSSTEENMSVGLIKAPTPERQTRAYEVGKAVGDVIGSIGAILGGPEIGSAKVVGGAARALTASASGLAISGRSVVASSGVALAAGRAAVVARSAHNFGKDMHQLAKTNGGGNVGSKSVGKPTPPSGSLNSKDVLKFLQKNGFEPVGQKGSHVKLKGPDGNIVIVPDHGSKDIPKGTLGNIWKQAGLK